LLSATYGTTEVVRARVLPAWVVSFPSRVLSKVPYNPATSCDQFVVNPIFCGGTLLNVLKEGMMGAAAEVLFELDDTDTAVGALVGEGDETTSGRASTGKPVTGTSGMRPSRPALCCPRFVTRGDA
jgi:hypothetical protein